ncbi:EthD family reductase [Roseovarius sp. ZX-A-9]|uniref:EthD family reductase n=1 Tax=Roseovarius sp. ZX-A-9 TaxID=3014783 RepID=UPI00232C8B70|nr:EthD family reductase [Roseovarius sp. ZX-A-9]MDX1785478.1 EthD family reductase [Roseovarius sp.]
MSVSLQVIYPATERSHFDMDYYTETHLPKVAAQFGAHLENTLVTRGISGPENAPAAYHAIATLVFADAAAFGAAMGEIGPLVEDIPNFTDVTPQMMIGEVL